MDEGLGIHHGPAIDRAAPFHDALRAAPSGTVSQGKGMGKQRSSRCEVTCNSIGLVMVV
jgi:hypothetical protein